MHLEKGNYASSAVFVTLERDPATGLYSLVSRTLGVVLSKVTLFEALAHVRAKGWQLSM